ncbi:MAG: glycoside hydrolase family 3 C-terminal domain-containing protein [Atopobiaceae bacterium]|nr:glycoside hydrolase family 3 C-terminal domain-containing protein [Atopobiaceae bacterium]
MSEKKGRSKVLPVVLAILAIAVVAANIAAKMFDSTLDKYAPGGGNPATVHIAEGSEDWDTEYYTAEYRGRVQATQAAEEKVAEVEAEGIVLMRNEDNALPLPAGTTVTLLGRYSADPIYGGAGSGTVDPASCIDFLAGLQNAGLTVNDAAYQFALANLANYPKANIVMDSPQTSAYYAGEIPWADYPADVQNSLAGTTGVVIIGRGGGEGGDLQQDLLGTLNSGASENFTANYETANYVEGQHQLELTQEEKDLIAAAKAGCDKVVVVLNLSTTMEVGPLTEGDYAVDAIIEVGSLGATGATAVGQVIAGQVNPSGRTTDLWAADFTKDPTFNNFGNFQYTDVSGFWTQSTDGAYFVEYEEGIYYGYRYYETAAVEGFIDYDEAVVYPFGYGLSYTDFEQTLDSVAIEDDNVVATVTVTNTGDVAGKSVAEVYYTAPYTKGGLEKSAVVLGSFDKTKLLEPGESQTLTISFPVRNMASWDSSQGAYVQDAGDYVISLRANSHDVIAEQTLALDAEVYDTDSATGNPLSNKFDDTTAYMEANTTMFSRADFAGTFPDGAEDKTTADAGITVEMFDPKAYAEEHSDVEMPTTGADNGLNLIDLRGVDKDDPLWDELLDQVTVDEMVTVLNDGAYNTAEIPSIGKPKTSDPDGPAGFTSLMGSTGNCAWCSEVVMAQTWNKQLMYEVGQMIGQEALSSGYNGWYAPAMNTHRSPFAGRNFEYYSEDPVLGGEIAAAVVRGAASNGCYAYIKHFALNDQETNRTNHIMTWATEQAIRECYLRPFEYCVKADPIEMKYISDDQGTVSTKEMPACTAVMSSFNFIGTEWSGGRQSLQTGILRDEWGFQGFVITDFNLYDYMNKNQGFYAGTDHMLTMAAISTAIDDTTSAPAVAAMRNSIKNICYTVVNSNAMNGVAPGTVITYGLAPWQKALYGASAAILALVAFGFFKWAKSGKKD